MDSDSHLSNFERERKTEPEQNKGAETQQEGQGIKIEPKNE